MKPTQIITALSVSLSMLLGGAAYAQTADTNAKKAETTQDSKREQRPRMTAEQLQDILPVYEQLRKDGHQKVVSVMQGPHGIHATVVNDKGEIVRLKRDKDSQNFVVWEPKKEDQRRHRRPAREAKPEAAKAN